MKAFCMLYLYLRLIPNAYVTQLLQQLRAFFKNLRAGEAIQQSTDQTNLSAAQQQHSSCQLPECCCCCCTLSLSCVEFHYKMNMSFRCFCCCFGTQTHRRTQQRCETKRTNVLDKPRQQQPLQQQQQQQRATSNQPTANSNQQSPTSNTAPFAIQTQNIQKATTTAKATSTFGTFVR